MKKTIIYIVAIGVILSGLNIDFKSVFKSVPKAQAASFDYNNIISDGEFINSSSMSLSDIQNFINNHTNSKNNKKSLLKDYTIPSDQVNAGKSVAQTIYDEAHQHGINPRVILTILYREQGFFSDQDPDRFLYGNDYALRRAMGWGFYDGSPYEDNYGEIEGIGNQIAYGANQLKNNYNRAAAGACYDIQTYSDRAGSTSVCANKASRALYIYTPYIYYGNHNFWEKYNNWFLMSEYAAQITAQGPYNGAGSYGYKLVPGEAMTLWVQVMNIGSATWYKNGNNPIHLGTSSPHDRNSIFLNNANVRAEMADSEVASGESTTFTFNATAPSSFGTYTEQFELLAEYKTWMNTCLSWSLEVVSPTAQYVNGTQGPFSGPGSYGNPISPGQTVTATVQFKNNSPYTWYRNGSNAVHLGADSPRDRVSSWVNSNRAASLTEASVSPNGVGTFEFDITLPSKPGVYGEHFRPVMEGIAWMNTEVYWEFIVGNPLRAQYVTQWPYTADAKIHLAPGETATLGIKYKNLSGANWYRAGGPTRNPIYLGQTNPRDRGSVFTGGANARGNLQSYGTAYGDDGTFTIDITAPSQKGNYLECFDPVIDGVGWFNSQACWNIIVE
ncbi:MAG: hypothetical protein WCW17_01240 [Patescibacteria group bacterium]